MVFDRLDACFDRTGFRLRFDDREASGSDAARLAATAAAIIDDERGRLRRRLGVLLTGLGPQLCWVVICTPVRFSSARTSSLTLLPLSISALRRAPQGERRGRQRQLELQSLRETERDADVLHHQVELEGDRRNRRFRMRWGMCVLLIHDMPVDSLSTSFITAGSRP